MSTLIQNELRNLHAAVIQARLGESRASLFAGVDPQFVAGLARASIPGEQLLLDLDALNSAGILENGSMPLAIWLDNALTLAGLREEASIFRAVLARCTASRDLVSTAPAHLAPKVEVEAEAEAEAQIEIEVRLFNLVAAQEWTMTVATTTTLLQLVGELKALLHARPWTAPGVPKPGSGYQFRCYRTEADTEPLSPHATMAQISTRASGARLSLNVEWYRSFRGAPGKTFR
jgi:hypothetical protein